MNLGENIYKNRTAKNWSQSDLAEALDVSRQSVSKWENNSATPELDKLIKMSDLFDITLDNLVYGEDAHRPSQLTANPTVSHSMRTIIGLILLSFGLVAFLLSVFWGNQLRMGEELAEILSVCVVFISVVVLATDNLKVLAFCAVLHFAYSVVCFGIMHVTSIYNYIFVFFTSIVIFVWFISLGLRINKEQSTQ